MWSAVVSVTYTTNSPPHSYTYTFWRKVYVHTHFCLKEIKWERGREWVFGRGGEVYLSRGRMREEQKRKNGR